MDLNEFTNNIFSFIGESIIFDRRQASLLFLRYATPRISYSEFCKMVTPNDQKQQGKILARVSREMSFAAEETLKRVLRAQLSLVQAQEFLRLRF